MSDKRVFTLDTLGELDEGTVRLLVDDAIADALKDCESRPMLESARKITITLELAPVPADAGGMRGVDVGVAVKVSVPTSRARPNYLKTTVMGDGVEAFLPTEHAAPLFPKASVVTAVLTSSKGPKEEPS